MAAAGYRFISNVVNDTTKAPIFWKSYDDDSAGFIWTVLSLYLHTKYPRYFLTDINLERGLKKPLVAGINARQPPQTAPPGRRLHVTTNLLQLKQRVNDDQIYPLSVNRDLKQITTMTATRTWRKKKDLPGRTIAQPVCFTTVYISSPCSAK